MRRQTRNQRRNVVGLTLCRTACPNHIPGRAGATARQDDAKFSGWKALRHANLAARGNARNRERESQGLYQVILAQSERLKIGNRRDAENAVPARDGTCREDLKPPARLSRQSAVISLSRTARSFGPDLIR
jgi:hypothetical protein